MSGSDLSRRLVVAGLGIPLGVAACYLGAWFVGAALALFSIMGALEAARFAAVGGARPFQVVSAIGSPLLVLGAAYFGDVAAWSVFAVGVTGAIGLGCLSAAVFLRGPSEKPLSSVTATVFATLYVGGTLSFGVHLRTLPGVSDGSASWEGALLLIFAMTVPWVGDSAAYFSGRALGRHKLIPSVSPAKTVEGGIGGLVGSTLAAVLFAATLLAVNESTSLGPMSAAAIGLTLGFVGQIGDLAESLLKREAGIKDSGTLFPGHGGMLDRFDSIFFALPVAYALLMVALP